MEDYRTRGVINIMGVAVIVLVFMVFYLMHANTSSISQLERRTGDVIFLAERLGRTELERDMYKFELDELERVGTEDFANATTYCGSYMAAVPIWCVEFRPLVIDDEWGHRVFHVPRNVGRMPAWQSEVYGASYDDWPDWIVPGYLEFVEAVNELEE